MTYKKFLEYNINLAPVGVAAAEDAPLYFCTPKGARVIGWAGMDGIHYCFVRGFSDMVFAVSPMNAPGDYVRPIAKTFADFLRLLLACGDAAVLEQAWAWNASRFDAFLAENPPDEARRAVLDQIQHTLKLAPMERPFAYLKALRETFDDSRILYTRDYDDFYQEIRAEQPLPPWKVTFEGGFWAHGSRERPGIELPVARRFDWDGQAVCVPSVYSCAKGLVVEICIEVSPDEISAHIDKWNLSPENDGWALTDEQRMLSEAENPLHVSFSPEIMLNGRALRFCHGSSLSWNPCFPDENGEEARGVLAHYGLDPNHGWVVSRYAFPWGRSRRPQVRALSLTICADTVAFPGGKLRGVSAGKRIPFTHPKSGARHQLIVQEYERQEFPAEGFGDASYEYPRHYIAVSYTVSPNLPRGAISLADRVQGDRPRKKKTNPCEPNTMAEAVSIGVIGGADGPTAIFVAGQEQRDVHVACSSLHYGDDFEADWQLVVHEKTRTDVTAELI